MSLHLLPHAGVGGLCATPALPAWTSEQSTLVLTLQPRLTAWAAPVWARRESPGLMSFLSLLKKPVAMGARRPQRGASLGRPCVQPQMLALGFVSDPTAGRELPVQPVPGGSHFWPPSSPQPLDSCQLPQGFLHPGSPPRCPLFFNFHLRAHLSPGGLE